MRRLLSTFRHLNKIDRIFLVVVAMLAIPSLLEPFSPQPFSYPALPIPILSQQVKPGGAIVARVERCNLSSDALLPYTLSRVLINTESKLRTQVPDGSAFMNIKGCETIESSITVVPINTPPGRYTLEAVATVRIGARVWYVPLTTTVFEVVK